MGKINILSVGETVSAEDADLGLSRLNTLLDSLRLESLFAYVTTETVFNLPANTTSRTIGPAQQINVARPTRIEAQSFSRLNGIDYPLRPISEPEYNAIALKSLSLGIVPDVCQFDGAAPTGVVYFWPPTSGTVEIHMVTMTPLTEFADLTTDYTLPPGYQRYLEYGLALEIAPDFRAQPSPFVMGAASNAKRKIKRLNHVTPTLDLGGSGTTVLENFLAGN